ncbi:MAG: PLP-dependent aminotransferase family protein [Planctomycetaceae bacterium]|nr:PLP-dependent aminotransferase family protein [Planctomycetaceae bacterium]
MSLPDIRFSQRRDQASVQSIAYLMKQGLESRNVISLAAGFVDEVTLPVSLVRESIADILTDDPDGHSVLQYGTTAGLGPLRDNLLKHMARLEKCSATDLNVTTNEIVVTSGSQQLLQHLSDALFDPGDICLVAAPTYFVFLGTLNGVGARTIAVDTDENGMCMDALEAELTNIEQAGDLNRVKMIYLVSSFENPSGVTLVDDRRKQVVEIAKRWSKEHRILILEDAAYRELRYEGKDGPSIWINDETRQHVILAQTFSKSFSPGIRVAYGVLPRDLVPAIHDVKGNFDFGSPNLNQRIVSHTIQSGKYEQHVAGLQSSYRVKRDAMLAAADEFFSDLPGVSWLRPNGGLYVWMTLPDEIKTGFESPLFRHATKTENVMYVPGDIAYPQDSPLQKKCQMRLSFGVEAPDTIREGMRRLSQAVRHVMY